MMTQARRPQTDTLSVALGGLAPIRENYARRPIARGVNGVACFAGITAGRRYLVVVRCLLPERADHVVLTTYDAVAHAEALQAAGPGLLHRDPEREPGLLLVLSVGASGASTTCRRIRR